jgi:hypothetical protein
MIALKILIKQYDNIISSLKGGKNEVLEMVEIFPF